MKRRRASTKSTRSKTKKRVPTKLSVRPVSPEEPLVKFARQLTENEADSLFAKALRHYFQQHEKPEWVPDVTESTMLLEGINDLTGRPCRIYVRPGKRVVMVETLS